MRDCIRTAERWSSRVAVSREIRSIPRSQADVPAAVVIRCDTHFTSRLAEAHAVILGMSPNIRNHLCLTPPAAIARVDMYSNYGLPTRHDFLGLRRDGRLKHTWPVSQIVDLTDQAPLVKKLPTDPFIPHHAPQVPLPLTSPMPVRIYILCTYIHTYIHTHILHGGGKPHASHNMA